MLSLIRKTLYYLLLCLIAVGSLLYQDSYGHELGPDFNGSDGFCGGTYPPYSPPAYAGGYYDEGYWDDPPPSGGYYEGYWDDLPPYVVIRTLIFIGTIPPPHVLSLVIRPLIVLLAGIHIGMEADVTGRIQTFMMEAAGTLSPHVVMRTLLGTIHVLLAGTLSPHVVMRTLLGTIHVLLAGIHIRMEADVTGRIQTFMMEATGTISPLVEAALGGSVRHRLGWGVIGTISC